MGIIQLAYMAYVSLAVQRAALAIAQEASLTGDRTVRDFRSKLTYSLAPLASLNPKTLASIPACQCSCQESFDKKNITVQIRYPMPIWVPLMGRIFGEPLVPHLDSSLAKGGLDLQTAAKFFGIPTSDFSSLGPRLPFYCWITFNASTHNEGYPN
jgi:hypothetical protein